MSVREDCRIHAEIALNWLSWLNRDLTAADMEPLDSCEDRLRVLVGELSKGELSGAMPPTA